MAWRSDLTDLVQECVQGSDMPLERFGVACRFIADRLDQPLSDEGLSAHFNHLVRSGDRLAAVNMLLPHDCSYSLARDRDGHCSASVQLAGSETEASPSTDDEGAALLAALAMSLAKQHHRGLRLVKG